VLKNDIILSLRRNFMIISSKHRTILMHIFLLLVLCVFTFSNTYAASAAPAAPITLTVTQPDGTEFQARAWGDEWLNGMETSEGYTILLSPESNYWVYAQLTPDQSLAPSLARGAELIVGRADPSGLPKHMRPQPSSSDGELPFVGSGSRGEPLEVRKVGPRNVLVLLVEFANHKGRTTPADWHDRIFGETNSMRHYYDEISFSQFAVLPAAENQGTINDGIVGWITLPYNHPNTGNNIGTANLQIARDAILAADDYVNFATYDTNGNGYLSFDELHIMVIVAGHEGAYGGVKACSPNVWAHQYALDLSNVKAPIVDGKKVASYFGNAGYTQFGEIHCDPANVPGHQATIGIIAHEFGHDLNWPDLYDTSGLTAGIGYWGLMGMGMWNYQGSEIFAGNSPAHPTAWSRWYQGWLTPFQLTASSLTVNIPQVQTSGAVLQLLSNPFNVDWIWKQKSGLGEYYLVENRQPVGYDAGLPGCGLLIWHINESVRFDNFANADANNRLVDLVQADGLRHLNISSGNRGDAGDPYPGITQNRVFNTSSNPSSNLGGVPVGVSVTEISDCHPMMTASMFVTTFQDVLPNSGWAWPYVEALVAAGITSGCGEGNYCPSDFVRRSEMAIFLQRGMRGNIFVPPPAAGDVFKDVPPDSFAADWIELLYADGITAGCGDGNYCPEIMVSRAEMAIFLLRAKYYPEAYSPPPAGDQTGFADVTPGDFAADWIKQLAAEGITSGCGDDNFCPHQAVTRAEMAAFLSRTFELLLP
jgi:M6 family metalloprotease-like protein